MNLEVLLKKAGEAGPFQLMLFILIGIVNLYTGMEMMVINFLAPNHPHWCHVPELAHLPSSIQLSAAIPWDNHAEGYSTCLMYDLPAANWSVVADMYHHRDTMGLMAFSDRETQEDIPTRRCDRGWSFDRSQFHNTIISEWLLVCGSEDILELISPIFTLGLFIGSLVGGMVSDRLGRMTSLLTFTVLHLLAGVATAFSPNIYFFIGTRFIIAVCIRGAGISGAVLLMESLTSRFRVAAIVGYQMFLGLGIVTISALAMLLRDFRELQLTIVVPLVCMIAYKWLLPESPVWFLSKGNTENAIKVVKKIAKMNEGSVPQRDYQEFQRQNDSKLSDVKVNTDESAVEAPLSVIDLMRHAVLRRYTLVSYFTMITCLFIDLGVALNLNSLFGDVYTNGFLTGASEMAANLLFYFAIQFLGRRTSLLICFIGIIGTESVSVTMQVIDMKFISSIMSILSRCLASSGYLTLNIFVAELFPTAVRQGALGSANAIAALVGIAAPLVGGNLHQIWFPLPNIIFGSMAMLCVPMCFLLPETKGQGMPQTLIDSVNLLSAPKVNKREKGEEKDEEKEDDDKLDDDVRNCMKDRRPNRHTHDLECGVFDDDGNLLYKENASLGDFSFSNVIRLDTEIPRPAYVYRIPIIPVTRVSLSNGNNDTVITHL